jgi:hypothetical protein
MPYCVTRAWRARVTPVISRNFTSFTNRENSGPSDQARAPMMAASHPNYPSLCTTRPRKVRRSAWKGLNRPSSMLGRPRADGRKPREPIAAGTLGWAIGPARIPSDACWLFVGKSPRRLSRSQRGSNHRAGSRAQRQTGRDFRADRGPGRRTLPRAVRAATTGWLGRIGGYEVDAGIWQAAVAIRCVSRCRPDEPRVLT